MTKRAQAPSGDRQRGRWLVRGALGLLGMAASTALAASAFFHVRLAGGRLALAPRFALGAWASDLPRHLPWVGAFALLTATLLPLRALQWRFALGPGAPGFLSRYHAVAIGAFLHNAVPGKLGDLARALLLARRHGLPFFESLGSVLVCKLFELAALVAVVALTLAGPLGAGFFGRLGPALLIAASLCLSLLAAALVLARHALPWGLALKRGRWPRLGGALMHLGKGLHATRSPKRAALVFLASLGPVVASALAYGVALQALGVHRGLWAGGVALGAVSLGLIIPGLPIDTGMYYLMTSWAARTLGASPAQAAAFAALTHGATFSTQLAIGFISVIVHRLRPSDLLSAVSAASHLEPAQAPPVAAGDERPPLHAR